MTTQVRLEILHVRAIWDVDDEELLTAARKHLEDQRNMTVHPALQRVRRVRRA